jgi:hypothetical protein
VDKSQVAGMTDFVTNKRKVAVSRYKRLSTLDKNDGVHVKVSDGSGGYYYVLITLEEGNQLLADLQNALDVS